VEAVPCPKLSRTGRRKKGGEQRHSAESGVASPREAQAIFGNSAGSIALVRALADFAEAYANQNERDYKALRAAQASARITVMAGL